VVGWTIGSGLLKAGVTDLLSRRAGRERIAWYRALPAVLERLGPAWIKFAQIASTRRDMLPAAVCDALAVLHAQVTPMSEDEVEVALAGALGAQWRTRLLDFEPAPVGSGSIACVYRATLVDGTVVAVKLRRPNVATSITRDIKMIQSFMDLLDRAPGLSRLPISDMGHAVGSTVLGQLDLFDEAHNLAALAETLAPLEFVQVPRPYLPMCSQACLVMEFVEGLETTHRAELIPAQRRSELARQILVAVYTMLFRTGLVHCDLHPGNLRLTGNDTIALLDAGFTYRIPDATRANLALFFLNLAMQNPQGCATAVLNSARQIAGDADLTGFSQDMDRLVTKYGGLRSADFDLPAFSIELFRSQQRRRIFAPPDFVFPLISLLMIEATIKDLDPLTDFQAIARPIVSDSLLSVADEDATPHERMSSLP
jgi:ubiquinone biosynthesis protein